MFHFFFFKTTSYSIQCESELKHADPVPKHKLIALTLVTRHGMRTTMEEWLDPEKAGFWQCQSEHSYSPRITSLKGNGFRRRFLNSLNDDSLSFQPSCHGGELTLGGMRQHAALGKFYRNYLVKELKFLPNRLDKELIGLRSSKIDRCIKSQQSFMSEFYPPANPGEEMEIITGTPYHEPLYPDYGQCTYLSEQWAKFIKEPEFAKRREQAERIYGSIFDKLNITKDGINWMFIGDWLYSYYCNDQDLPDYVTDEMVDQALLDVAWYSYGFFDYTPGANGASIWRVALRDFDALLGEKTKKKFWMYSAHDSTIAAVLNSFGISGKYLPPYRSHLAIELWQKGDNEPYLRLVLNGDAVKIPAKDSELIKYSEAKELLKPSVEKFCVEELP